MIIVVTSGVHYEFLHQIELTAVEINVANSNSHVIELLLIVKMTLYIITPT